MPLQIDTFQNGVGGSSLYKALSHPLAAEQAAGLLAKLRAARSVALYDPEGIAAAFAEFYPLDGVELSGLYVQNVERLGSSFAGHKAQAVSLLVQARADVLFIASFDQSRALRQIGHLLPKDINVLSFEALKLPQSMQTDRSRYLTTLNFATNFVFFRDAGGHHTRLVSANYWTRYGARDVRLWCRLFGVDGSILASWEDACPSAEGSIVIDSADIKARFNLGDFTGQLFIHVIGAAGHDIVKYALDTYGDAPGVLSQTHDSNSWPADFYAGLPAPDDGEDVVLWVQNSHPSPIAAGEIALGLMGGARMVPLKHPIAPYASHRLSVRDLLPEAHWPQQIEIYAGKHLVRPRYEVFAADGRSRIAHPNVERSDLKPDARLAELGEWFGKGFILPAPVLPPGRFRSLALPTPMATSQRRLPVKAVVYAANGSIIGEHRFGNLARAESAAIDLSELAEGIGEAGGHAELMYDFRAGDDADGWLHALFRYRHIESGHVAETSFGAHIFNSALTYKGEPQSYSGPPPGLSTRLFLRVAPAPLETLCHLTYPVSKSWHASSTTELILISSHGKEIARKALSIPASGSLFWQVNEVFGAPALAEAGAHPYVIIRDETCRLFGYQGAMAADGSFGFDHMFGF